MSKCGMNKKVAKKAQLSLSLILLNHILISFIIYSWTDPQQQGIYLYNCIKKEQNIGTGDVIYSSVYW